jgi:hypothetical protein
MAWNDIAGLELRLNTALNEFNWSEAEEICNQIIARIKSEPDPFPERSAKNLMYMLRRKRRYQLMTQLAEALMQSGLRTPQVRRQYAQALIDQGIFAAGEMVLQSIIHDPQGLVGEELEARGLTGRIYKQLYVNNNDPQSVSNRANLERALNEYLYVYRLDPQKHLWHGINVVALTARAARDKLSLAGLPDTAAMAEEILKTIARREEEATEPLPAWDVATAMEAYVALGRHEEAVAEASRYLISNGADAFELASTIRQLTEVWQLNDQEPPGSLLLPICKAGHLSKSGAIIEGNPKKISEDAAAAGSAIEAMKGEGFEKVFTEDAMKTLVWYKKGLDQCNSIARVERLSGKGHGTGWLVKAEDFFADRQGLLLLTNEHVISGVKQHPYALLPENAQANFQVLGQVLQVKEVVWSSSYKELDATFVSLEGEPKAEPLRLSKSAMQMAEPPPRMYIIGHPLGRDLEISLQDNNLLACNEKLLHYRTPTEPGSSGSPVFEPENWRVVALHHKGRDDMPRIDGKAGTYKANEGIAIAAIKQGTEGGY